MNEAQASPETLETSALDAYHAQAWHRAAEGFMQAAAAYQAASNHDKWAEMRNNACVAYLQDGDGQAALSAVEGTSQAFIELGDQRRAAQAHGNRAAALEACGRLQEAEGAYRLAAEGMRLAGDHEARSDTLKALAQLQLKRGRAMDAVASMGQELETRRRPSLAQRFLRWLTRLAMRLLGG